jgi:hypothetical protein
MDLESRRELHSIIAAQGVLSRQGCRSGNQPGRHLDDAVLVGEIDPEIRDGDGGVLGCDRTATFPACDGGNRLGQRDPRKVQRMPGGRSGQGLHPGGAGLLDVSLKTVLVSRK